MLDPARDFFVRAAVHAKQGKIKELNYIEAELIMMGEEILSLQEKGILTGEAPVIENKVEQLKDIVKKKKQVIQSKTFPWEKPLPKPVKVESDREEFPDDKEFDSNSEVQEPASSYSPIKAFAHRLFRR